MNEQSFMKSLFHGVVAEELIYPAVADTCSAARVRELRAAAVRYLRADCRGWGAYD